VSTKNSLKDRIKKPNATQAFFNSYDTDKDENNNIDNNENENSNNNVDENKNINKTTIKKDVDINDIDTNKNIENNNVNNNDKTYVIDNNNNNDNDNVVVDNDEENDYLRELALGKKPTKKKNKKVFTSFYMDPDLAVEVDKIAARGEKGDKSKLLNMSIRRLLEEYGVIEKK
jgi:hypothetical protein